MLGASLAKTWKGAIDLSNPMIITWTAIGDYPAGSSSRLAATGVSGGNYVFFTGGDPTGQGSAARNDTWAYDIVNNGWWHAAVKPTGVSNIDNLVPLIKNDSMYLAIAGGYNGSGIVTSNEWLNIGRVSAVLPLRLLEFTALLSNGKTQLKWRVSEDGLGGKYNLQKSETAGNFKDFKSIDAGRKIIEAGYNSFDPLPYNGYTYYRVKIINIDGAATYSSIKLVFNNKHTSGIVASLYPNPSFGRIKIELQTNVGRTVKVNVLISDISGHKITGDVITLENLITKDYALKPGTYVVTIFTDDKALNQTEKLVVF